MMSESAASWRAEYPFASHFLGLGALRYHYLDEGAGQPLLFVHGNPTWSFAWRTLIQDLSADYRCVAVDHIGCGLSDKPSEYAYTLESHINNLCAVVEQLDLRGVTLIAHDWGGAIGMGAAGRLPERFARLVLMNTAAFRSTQIPKRIALCRTPWLGPLAVRGANAFARAALGMAVERPERLTPAVRAGYLAPYNSWANRVAVQKFVEDIPLRPSHPSYSTLVGVEQALPRLAELPMLLLWGMQDWCFTPAFLAEFQRRFPEAQTLEIPAAGHYVFEDAPEILLPRIRQFLAQTPAT